MVLDEIRHTELARAVAIDAVAETLGLAPGCSLRELAEAAPSPWDGIFNEHRTAFLTLTEEVSMVANTNRELVTKGQQAVAARSEERPVGKECVCSCSFRLLSYLLQNYYFFIFFLLFFF